MPKLRNMTKVVDSPKVKIKKVIIVAVVICICDIIFGKVSIVASTDKMVGNELLISIINFYAFILQLVISGISVGWWIKESVKGKLLYAFYSMIFTFILFIITAQVFSSFVMQGWIPCKVPYQDNCHVGLQWKPDSNRK